MYYSNNYLQYNSQKKSSPLKFAIIIIVNVPECVELYFLTSEIMKTKKKNYNKISPVFVRKSFISCFCKILFISQIDFRGLSVK